MPSPNGAKGVLVLSSIIILVIPCFGGTGSSVWNVTGADFLSGEMAGTLFDSGTVALDTGNISGGDWSKVGDWIGPCARSQHSMAFDSRNGLVIMFSGDLYAPDSNDTWAYNPLNNSWTDLKPPSAPSPRDQSAMAFDERNGVTVLYGGGHPRMNDTWTYNATTNTWTNITSDPNPGPMYGHKMVYDRADGVILLFGGTGPGGPELNNTWALDTATGRWTELNATGAPSPRYDFEMAYDQAADEVILIGGVNIHETNITWIFNHSTKAWRQLSTPGSPSETAHLELVYDEKNRVSVLFGEGENQNNTWVFSSSTGGWTKRNPQSSPPGREWYGLAYDSWNHRTILFGGHGGMGSYHDTWSYDAGTNLWRDKKLVQNPMPRDGHSMVYNDANDACVLFGGILINNDTWAFRPEDNTWVEMKPPVSPKARIHQAMAYDSNRGFVVLFGGGCYPEGQGNGIEMQDDLWTYDLGNNTWTRVVVQGDRTPSRRESSAMVYDPNDGIIIMFGGYISEHQLSNETWIFHGDSGTWTDASPANSPPPRFGHSMAFDKNNGLVVLFGGYDGTACLNDTWTYDVVSNNWTRQDTAGEPQARIDHSMEYIPSAGGALLFGGWDDDAFFNDTWLFNTSLNRWGRLSPVVAPPQRFGQGICYDDSRDRIILFSGFIEGIGRTPDTWTFNITGYVSASGTYTSQPFDAGGPAGFGGMSWNASVPSGTSMAFQTRAADSLENLTGMPFTGPDGSSGSFYDNSGERIAALANGSRWVQYRASLFSMDRNAIPVLRSVEIDFNLFPRLKILSPAGGENWSGPQNLTWSASDSDNDTLSFDILLENATDSIPLATGCPGETNAWPWDTDTVPNGTFRIRLVARDDNPSIPLTVDAVSGNFIIFHPPPPPNLPPAVSLLSPLNNSIMNATSVRLEWTGTDPENDPLVFSVRVSESLSGLEAAGPFRTEDNYQDLSDLADNRTYFWTVDASDGTNYHTDLPAAIRAFTVRIPAPPPPVNHPPVIISTPSLTVIAGELYQYNLSAFDEDFNVLRCSLVNGPQNMTIDETSGRLRWQTTLSDAGNHSVTVRVTDTSNASDNQTFTIAVLAPFVPPQKPSCAITSPANGSKVSGRITVKGTAVNGSLPITIVQVRIDDGGWYTAAGLGNWSVLFDLSRTQNGRHTIEARSFDGSLYSDTASVELDLRNPEPAVSSDGPPWVLFIVIVAAVVAAAAYLIWRIRRK